MTPSLPSNNVKQEQHHNLPSFKRNQSVKSSTYSSVALAKRPVTPPSPPPQSTSGSLAPHTSQTTPKSWTNNSPSASPAAATVFNFSHKDIYKQYNEAHDTINNSHLSSPNFLNDNYSLINSSRGSTQYNRLQSQVKFNFYSVN